VSVNPAVTEYVIPPSPHWASLAPRPYFHTSSRSALPPSSNLRYYSTLISFCTLSNQNNVCVPFCAKCATSLANFNQSDNWWRTSTQKFLVIQVSQLPQNSSLMCHAPFPSILQTHSFLVILFS
jgi:hypothetical protein